MKKLKKIIFSIAVSIFAFVFFHLGWLIIDGLIDEIEDVEVIVVLGNKVNEDGTLSKRLKSRLDKAIKIYEKGFADKIIVSGGLGKEGFLEGDVMQEYLISKKIPEENIIVDNKGNNTYLTARNVKKLRYEKVLIVTNYYHIIRTEMIFENMGMKVYSAKADMWPELRDPYSIFREFIGYYYYYFKY